MEESTHFHGEGETPDAARRRVLRRAAGALYDIGRRTPILIRHLPPHREPTSLPEELLRVARHFEELAQKDDPRRFSEGLLALAQSSRSLIANTLSSRRDDVSPEESAALRALLTLLRDRELLGD